MKLRYYLRGLGIGIIVTALLMGFVTREKLPLTDAEIKARAKALGMVESDSRNLSDLQPPENPARPGNPSGDGSEGSEPSETGNPSGDGSEGFEPSESGNPSGGESEGSEPSESGNPSGDGSEGPEPSAEAGNPPEGGSEGPEPSESGNPSGGGSEGSEPAEPQTVTFTVKSGYSSDKVSKLLEEAGLVEDAGEFNRYLVKGGYANRISVGTYEIEVGASMERLAKIITKSR